MSNDALIVAVKKIVAIARDGDLDEAYRSYTELFCAPEFPTHRPQDQRSVLRLMILAKHVPRKPTPAMMAAHRAASEALASLVAAEQEPGDYEMLGVCQVVLGDETTARVTLREGLALERLRNPQSDLCGSFMKRISFL